MSHRRRPPGGGVGSRAWKRGPARHVVVVAAGDVPVRATLDAAWPGWDDGVDAVIAADGGLANAAALDLDVSCVVGDLDSADPERRQGGGGAWRPDPALARGQGRVRHRAGGPRGRPPRGDADHDPGRPRRRAPRPRARQRLAPRPRRPGRRARGAARRARPRVAARCPGPGRAASIRAAPARPDRRHRVAVAVRAVAVDGRHDPGSPLPASRRAPRRGPGARPVQRPDRSGRRGRDRPRAAPDHRGRVGCRAGLSSEP